MDDVIDLNLFGERHHRLGAGYSENSWIKHDLAQRLVAAQVSAHRIRFPDRRMLLIDGNAGDGSGVAKLQLDMFQVTTSRPTAQLLCDLAKKLGSTDVVLCDKNKLKRFRLMHRFPTAMVVERHPHILRCIRQEHAYALWLSDPCGYSAHGIEEMQAASRMLMCDFVIIFNEGALNRLIKTKGAGWQKHRELYGGMIDPQWWLATLNKKYLARTRVINASTGFRYRILVLSNFIADGVRRLPVEILA